MEFQQNQENEDDYTEVPGGFKVASYGGGKKPAPGGYQTLPKQSASLFSKNNAYLRRREINQPGEGNETNGGGIITTNTLRGTELDG
jgi:hypothetical protein